MITSDTAEIFPSCPTFGFTASPRYRVPVIERSGGYERRTRKWARPLNTFTAVPIGDRPEDDIQQVLYFFHAHGGRSVGFRFKDYADYKSCAVQEAATALDQPLVEVPDSPGVYQLIKQYQFGALTQQREIFKPKGDTIRIANELGVEQPSDRWTINEATGILEPEGSFSGVPTSWGGEFYVYARFRDEQLDVELTNYRIQACSFAVVEIRVDQ